MAARSDQMPLAAASSSLKRFQGGRLGPRAGPDAMVTTEIPVATGHPVTVTLSQFVPYSSSDSDKAAAQHTYRHFAAAL